VYGSAQRLENEELVFTEKDIRGGRSILKVQAAREVMRMPSAPLSVWTNF
jgi:hypothetical protein